MSSLRIAAFAAVTFGLTSAAGATVFTGIGGPIGVGTDFFIPLTGPAGATIGSLNSITLTGLTTPAVGTLGFDLSDAAGNFIVEFLSAPDDQQAMANGTYTFIVNPSLPTLPQAAQNLIAGQTVVPGTYASSEYGDSATIPGARTDFSNAAGLPLSGSLDLNVGFFSDSLKTSGASIGSISIDITPAGVVAPVTSQWNSGSGGSWATVGNWTNGVPNGQAARAVFATAPGFTAPAVVTLDGSYTVGQITYTNANPATIAADTGGTLTFDDAGDSAGTADPRINVQLGRLTITAPVVLVNGLTVSVGTGTALTLGGPVTGSGVLTKSGPGPLTLAGADSFGPVVVNGGSVTLSPGGSLGGNAVAVNGGGTFTFAAAKSGGFLVRTAPLILNTGGIVTAAAASSPASRQLVVAPSLTLARAAAGTWTALLDLANNDLDAQQGNLATITSQVRQGYAGGTWQGSGGTTSSAAAADAGHLTALGVILNTTDGTTPMYGSGTTAFDGTNPAATDVLVKYTYYGDANLDGKVDGQDYVRIDAGYAADRVTRGAVTGWYNGDFNYDGTVDGSDYTLIDNAFNFQQVVYSPNAVAVPTAEVAAAAVPEPAAIGLFAAAAVGLSGRRLKR